MVDVNAGNKPVGKLELGAVASRTFSAIGGNLVPFLLLSVLLAGVPTFLISYLTPGITPGSVATTPTASGIGYYLLGTLISVAAAYVLIGAITHGSIIFYNGRKASVAECLATGLKFAFPLLGVGILTGLGVMLGMILLIVPGIFLAITWLVAAPSMVTERLGVGASISRSRELTTGNRWRIFWLCLIYVVVGVLLETAITLPATLIGGGSLLIVLIVFSAISSAVTSVIASCGVAAIYYELRVLKEGATSDDLAKVFE